MDSDERYDDYDDETPEPDAGEQSYEEEPAREPVRSRPSRKSESKPAKRTTEKKTSSSKSGKQAKDKDKAKKEKKKPTPPPPRGKWSGGTASQRAQRLHWISWHVWRWLPVILIILIALAIFVPPMMRGVQPIPVIAPFYTREVQYWAPKIQQWSTQYDVNPNLIATLMQIESCGYPGAASSVGAQGLFQVMPMHFSDNENMTDPETNAARGISVIRECLGYAEGDVGLAMACYNGGPSLIYRNSANWPAE